MFDTLIETRARRDRHWAGQVVSVVLHAGMIATAVFTTQQVVEARAPVTREEVVFIRNPEPETPPPVVQPPNAVVKPPLPKGFQVVVAPVEIPTVLPDIDLTRAVTNAADFNARQGVPGGVANGVEGGVVRPVTDTTAYFSHQVEKPAALLAGSPTPVYPELLKSAGIEGSVRVLFVIGTDGRAEMSTFKVLESDHARFSDAVRAALPSMRFLPAETGGMKVRQLVEMPFDFHLGRTM